MLEIKAQTQNWQDHTRISAADLAALVLRIGNPGDEFLVIQRIPDLPDVFIQTAHRHGEGYELQYRSGDGMFGTTVDEGAGGRVAAAVTGWARQEDGWDAGFSWERIELPEPAPLPELEAGIRCEVEGHVRGLLRQGYHGRAALTEAAEEWLVSGDERPVSRAQAAQIVDRLWLERVEEQSGWTGTTDPDRVTRAFEALERRGITARENFTCCRSCGLTEIYAAGSPAARGFVFFHAQGTESAAEHHGLSLYYGGFECTAEETAAIGREAVAVLTEAGLTAEWDGSPDRAIEVTGLDWRKRLTG
ncbi:hypothetical protein P8605_34850 [Streptomyces sp. T-3]|nr:hypothetical protein [Streptomyces sp. T-3]